MRQLPGERCDSGNGPGSWEQSGSGEEEERVWDIRGGF